jgi:hypothetical protein
VLPELVNRYVAPPNPVVIYYTVNPSTPPPERPSAWDIDIKLEDVALKSKMQAVTLNASRDTSRELTKLDDEVRPGSIFPCVFVLTIAPVDRHPCTIAPFICLKETVPTVICRGSIWFYPNVASVSVARSRVDTR